MSKIMARKCRLATCRAEIPKAKDSDFYQEAGFCNNAHMADHGQIKGKQKQERARKAIEKKERAQHKEAKLKVKKRTAYVNDAQKLQNQIVVLEDKGKGCISCTTGNPVTDSGHYFHRGNRYRVSPLTLLRLNLNGQCELCNRWEGGRQHEYMEGFIDRYGADKFAQLVEFKREVDRGEIMPLTIDECKELIIEYKEKLKEIKGKQ